MIKKFGIKNFRTFGANGKMAEFEFRPITILTGPNGAGKSSLFKALLLVKDSIDFSDSKGIFSYWKTPFKFIEKLELKFGSHGLGLYPTIKCNVPDRKSVV